MASLIFLSLVCLSGLIVGVYMIRSALSGKVDQPPNDWMFSGLIAEIFAGKRKWAILCIGVVWTVVWLVLLIAILVDSILQ